MRAASSRAAQKHVPVAGPNSAPRRSARYRIAATLAASGTGTTASTRSALKAGSIRGRPMPGIRDGIPVAYPS